MRSAALAEELKLGFLLPYDTRFLDVEMHMHLARVMQLARSDGVLCALKKINIFDMMDQKQREKCLKEVQRRK